MWNEKELSQHQFIIKGYNFRNKASTWKFYKFFAMGFLLLNGEKVEYSVDEGKKRIIEVEWYSCLFFGVKNGPAKNNFVKMFASRKFFGAWPISSRFLVRYFVECSRLFVFWKHHRTANRSDFIHNSKAKL